MPDAVLLDWNMPVMDGFEFLPICAAARRRPPKVVFCTTENGIDHIVARAACGRQRVHHEAVRQGHRRCKIPGSRTDRGAGVNRFCLFCSFVFERLP